MKWIAVDLGSTNLKVAAYDETLSCVAWESAPVRYERAGDFVEFDVVDYCRTLHALIKKLVQRAEVPAVEISQIVLTGQAESLVVLGADGKPLMNAISWMDARSGAQCAALAQQFDAKTCEAVTGQLAVLPTWPATKILWLRRNKPEIFNAAAQYLLLKDYLVYALTGRLESDCSIATFSFYFDIYKRRYWPEMLAAIGITAAQLPPLAEPCGVAGSLLPGAAAAMGLPDSVRVNRGTLDHFAGMVGTGNVRPGGVSLSTGTVMALASMVCDAVPDHNCQIAMHYGFRPNSWVMLPVIESGGVSLEWFKRACMPDVTYEQLGEELARRTLPNGLLFLPYLVGTNAPEFDAAATGMFYGLRAEHDAFDMAAAVMEGVSFLLRRNCDDMRKKGTEIAHIIATGGGSNSAVWCQMQANITGLPVLIPQEKEAACLGAAMIGAVSDGVFSSFESAAETVKMVMRFEPHPSAVYEQKYRKFCALYKANIAVAAMD